MEYLIQIGKKAKAAKENIRLLETARKNQILRQAAADLSAHAEEILRANEKDMEQGRKNGMSEGLLDRLLLTRSGLPVLARDFARLLIWKILLERLSA